MRFVRILFLLAIPAGLVLACIRFQPFAHTIQEKHISVRALSSAQRTNLAVALRSLDGIVLKPGEYFSFNRMVGPRTLRRGYLAAPSYLEGDSPATVGGGICLLSSALYQLVLESGLKITHREPHLRTIHSIPPGLDATVWYGGADLQLYNSLPDPVQLKAAMDSEHLHLTLLGNASRSIVPVKRQMYRKNRHEVLVTVFQGTRMVSRDLYRLAP